MKKVVVALMALLCVSCATDGVKVKVVNNSSIAREGEMVEVVIESPESYVVYNSKGEEITSQVTYDGKLIFQADVAANKSAKFTLKQGEKSEYPTISCGQQRPIYCDDIAWENDKVGFRVSGMPQLAQGRYLYGYDIFTKRVDYPVLDEFYEKCFGQETKDVIAILQRTNPDSVGKYRQSRSIHIDHGKGMDYYLVGPTLGCGTAALVVDGVTKYPLYYTDYEFLDAGPLRTTFTMDFGAVDIGSDKGVVERRKITLDAGTHFNKIEVVYDNLTRPQPVIAGVVMRDAAEKYELGDGYLAYIEPKAEVGQIYDGVIYPEGFSAVVDLFDEAGMSSHGGAFGHIQAEGVYNPGDTFTYYAGAGWNKWLLPTPEDWFDHIELQQLKYATPLVVEVK